MVNSIILVGPMGAGKSTIGKLLASRLRYDFLDTDSLIEERTGADIPWIFDVEGEPGFRERESVVLQEAVKRENCVIATGGGIVLAESNRREIKKCRLVVYLTANIDQLVERTCKDKKRPLLQVDNPEKKIIELIRQRDPLYKEVATDILKTDGRSPKHVVQDVVNLL